MPEEPHRQRVRDTSRPSAILGPNREYWLHRVMRHACGRDWCSKIGCTTCGATPLRNALREEAFRAASRSVQRRYDRVTALHLAAAVAGLNPDREEAESLAGPTIIALNELLSSPLDPWLLDEILRGHWAHDLLPEAGYPLRRQDAEPAPAPPPT